MPGAAENAATQCSTRVWPLSTSNCLGSAAPKRVPVPPPSTTATMRFTVTTADFTRYSRRGSSKETGVAGYADVTAPYQYSRTG